MGSGEATPAACTRGACEAKCLVEAFVKFLPQVSTLVKVDTPQGEAMVPDMGVVKRAIDSDLNRTARYTVAFTRNSR